MAYCSVSDVSDELKGLTIDGSSTPSSTVVTEWISQAEKEIELKTHRVWSSTAASSTLLDYDGTGFIKLPHKPVISVSLLKYEKNGLGAASADWQSLTEGRTNDFILHQNDGEIELTGKTYSPSHGSQNIMASYVHGYNSVPSHIKRLAALIVAKRVMEASIHSEAQSGGGSVSVGNISVSESGGFGVNHVRAVGEEIANLFSSLASGESVYRMTRDYRFC